MKHFYFNKISSLGNSVLTKHQVWETRFFLKTEFAKLDFHDIAKGVRLVKILNF